MLSENSQSTKDCEMTTLSEHREYLCIYWTVYVLLTVNKELCHDCDTNIQSFQKKSYLQLKSEWTKSNKSFKNCFFIIIYYMISSVQKWCEWHCADDKLKFKKIKILFNATDWE